MRYPAASCVSCTRVLAIAIACLALPFAGGAAALEELKIGGTGNALGTMRLLAEAFAKQNPDLTATVLPSLGSSGAIKAIPMGVIDVGLSARPLTQAEIQLGATGSEYARTPLVFAVASKTAAQAITMEQIAAMYAGRTANWPDGSQVRPILRQVGDDNTQQVKAISPAMDAAMIAAELRPGMPFATTDQEAAEKIASIPGALGVTTLALITSEGRPLRALTIDGVEATPANGASGKYVYVKRFYLITRTVPSAATKRFVAFVQAPAGREILVRAGHWIP